MALAGVGRKIFDFKEVVGKILKAGMLGSRFYFLNIDMPPND
jgi:hypothetical protein